MHPCSKEHNILIQVGKPPPVTPGANKGAPGPHGKQLVLGLPQSILFMPENPLSLNIWDASRPDARTSASTGSSQYGGAAAQCLAAPRTSELLILFEPSRLPEETQQLVSV